MKRAILQGAGICILLAMIVWSGASSVRAQTAEPAAPRPLVVATKEAPPFAMKGPDGAWQGISITLWREVAETLGVPYSFVETDLPGMLDGVASGRFDAAAAALTVTAARQDRMDFSHPYFSTGLGIAVRADTGIATLIDRLPWRQIALSLATLTALMLIAGLVLWLLERRHNREHFGGDGGAGLGDGIWWSAVTMSTVGYGDRTPQTLAGRAFAVIWMLVSVILIASFTATMTSALTVERLSSAITGPDDLQGRRLGSIEASTGAGWLAGRRMPFTAFATVVDGLDAVAAGKIDAFVHDRPILLYYASGRASGEVTVLPAIFDRQDYAFALPSGSPLRKPVNKALLETVSGAEWPAVLDTWLGADR